MTALRPAGPGAASGAVSGAVSGAPRRAALALALGLAAGGAQALTIPVSEAMLQQRVAARFPVSRAYPLGVRVALSNPVVSLADPAGRVGLVLDAAVELPGQVGEAAAAALAGRASLSGAVRYEPAGARFLLDDARVESVDVPHLPPAYLGLVRAVLDAVAGAALRSVPIYELGEGGGFAESYARQHLKSVRVESGRLLLELD